MAELYIDTPRTEGGNSTFLNNAHNLDQLSVENSFQIPAKHENDLLKQIRSNRRGLDLRTPRSRAPFTDRRNKPAAPAHGEFTPLMKSVTKNNHLRNGKQNGVPDTPAFLKPGFKSIAESPALPAPDISAVYGDETGSSFSGPDEKTPIPRVASSSAQSTPLAALPKRDGGGLFVDGATLKEQENIINKVEKENFGLKLKIHFLEEQLRKAGPGLNEAALKENTELKVTRITMQKELHRYRKSLGQAERDLEECRSQFSDLQSKARQKHADASLREELESVKKDVQRKEVEIKALKEQLRTLEDQSSEAEKLKDEVEDLQAELREKDRIIEEREDEVEAIKEQANKDSTAIAELEEEMETSQKEAQDLQDKLQNANSEKKKAQEDSREALEERERAEDDLNELRDEMANKSFHTKGLSRQLEDKASKLQNNLDALREEHAKLQEKFEDKVRLSNRLQEKVDDLEKETGSREHKLHDQLELVQHERDSLRTRLEHVSEELRDRKEEKDLLQSRHDALTTESQILQKDLRKAQATATELEVSLANEQQHAADNEQALRNQSKDEIERLMDDVDDVRRELEDKETKFATQQDHWESIRRGLESQRERAEEQATGLQRTIQKLQESEGTLSGRDMKLQQALESEKQRHEAEEAVLNRQIQELNGEVDKRRQTCEEARSELSRVKEELRLGKREEDFLNEKIQGLEDEIVILQGSLDEEAERAKANISTARHESEGLRRQLRTAKQDLEKAEAAYSDARDEVEAFQGDLDAGNGSREQLSSRLRDVEAQLQNVRTEKQSVQDRLTQTKSEMHSLRNTADEIEVERDELKSQLHRVQNQLGETRKYDQEKTNLRQAKVRLEGEIARSGKERKALVEKTEAIEKDLEAEIERGASEEGRLSAEVAALRSKLALASEGRDKELSASKQKAQRLELRIGELENLLELDKSDDGAAAELSMIRKDLSAARKKETDYLQREASHKDNVRDLKHKIAILERQLHEVEIEKLKVDSPRSSVGGSARKSEIVEVRQQLAEAHQQMKELRSKLRDTEHEAQRKIAAAEHESRTKFSGVEQDRDLLEQEIEECRLQQEEQVAKKTSAEHAISRLRTKIQRLEKDLHEARADTIDRTIAEERKDLHEMLKDAKLEVEELQLQLSERDSKIQSYASREKNLLAQLKRVREERASQRQRANAATVEMMNVQTRYEQIVGEMGRQRQLWDEERKSLTHGVRFANMSISSVHYSRLEEEIEEKERTHELELRGLIKQAQWLRAKLNRAEGFRADLAYEKRYYLLQIAMYNKYNKLDLQLIEKMGVKIPRKVRPKKAPLRHLRVVAFMVLAGVKMRRRGAEWAVHLELKASMVKTKNAMRRVSKRSLCN